MVEQTTAAFVRQTEGGELVNKMKVNGNSPRASYQMNIDTKTGTLFLQPGNKFKINFAENGSLVVFVESLTNSKLKAELSFRVANNVETLEIMGSNHKDDIDVDLSKIPAGSKLRILKVYTGDKSDEINLTGPSYGAVFVDPGSGMLDRVNIDNFMKAEFNRLDAFAYGTSLNVKNVNSLVYQSKVKRIELDESAKSNPPEFNSTIIDLENVQSIDAQVDEASIMTLQTNDGDEARLVQANMRLSGADHANYRLIDLKFADPDSFETKANINFSSNASHQISLSNADKVVIRDMNHKTWNDIIRLKDIAHGSISTKLATKSGLNKDNEPRVQLNNVDLFMAHRAKDSTGSQGLPRVSFDGGWSEMQLKSDTAGSTVLIRNDGESIGVVP